MSDGFNTDRVVALNKWGNSRGIRVTKEMLDYLHAGDSASLEISYVDDGILLHKKTIRKSLQEYAEPYGGKLGPYQEFDWGDGIGFEEWVDQDESDRAG